MFVLPVLTIPISLLCKIVFRLLHPDMRQLREAIDWTWLSICHWLLWQLSLYSVQYGSPEIIPKGHLLLRGRYKRLQLFSNKILEVLQSPGLLEHVLSYLREHGVLR